AAPLGRGSRQRSRSMHPAMAHIIAALLGNFQRRRFPRSDPLRYSVSMASKLLLVAPPWRLPYTASLALGTLAPILRAEGFEVDELHGAVLFPQTASSFDFIEGYAK